MGAHLPVYGPNAIRIGMIALGVLAAVAVLGLAAWLPGRGRARRLRRRRRRR